jgi:YVTN family beta-propeller protein
VRTSQCQRAAIARELLSSYVAAAIFFGIVLLIASAAHAAPFAYISNSGSNTVSVIDVATITVTATVTVGSFPVGVAVTPDGSRVYVNNDIGTVSVIDTATNTVIGSPIPVGTDPHGIAITPDGSRAYVTNLADGNVSVISTATNTVIDTVTVGGVGSLPQGVAVSPDGFRVYVANYGDNSVSVISTVTNTVTGTVAVGFRPFGVAVSPDGSKLYVAAYGSGITNGNVAIVNTTNNAVIGSPITVGIGPDGIAVTTNGARVYVANFLSNTVSVIDTTTHTVIGSPIAVGINPVGIAVSPDGARVYVANFGSNTVSVISTATNTVVGSPIAVGNSPYAFGLFITPAPPPPAPAVTLSHSSVNFGSVTIGDHSIAQTVNLTNSGTADLVLGSLISTNSYEFYIATDTCSDVTLSPNASCSFSLLFEPAFTGVQTGAASILSNAAGSPHSVELTGIGTVTGTPPPIWHWSFDAPPATVGPSDVLTVGATITNDSNSPHDLVLTVASGTGEGGTPPTNAQYVFEFPQASTFFRGQPLPPGQSFHFTFGTLTPRTGTAAPGSYALIPQASPLALTAGTQFAINSFSWMVGGTPPPLAPPGPCTIKVTSSLPLPANGGIVTLLATCGGGAASTYTWTGFDSGPITTATNTISGDITQTTTFTVVASNAGGSREVVPEIRTRL